MHSVVEKFLSFSTWLRRFKRRRARIVGQVGEWIAMIWLLARGHRIVERNLRVRRGEIDLLVHDGRALRIVEVRTITTHYLGGTLEAFNSRKQIQVRRTAHALEHRLHSSRLQESESLYVDFMGIQLKPWWNPQITYLKHVEGIEGMDCTEYYSSTSSFTQ